MEALGSNAFRLSRNSWVLKLGISAIPKTRGDKYKLLLTGTAKHKFAASTVIIQ